MIKSSFSRVIVLSVALLCACSPAKSDNADAMRVRANLNKIPLDQKVKLTNAEWELILTPEQFHVLRKGGTERPSASGNASAAHSGIYVCAACGNPLYDTGAKFNSHTGWPSFWQPIRKEAVQESSMKSAFWGTEISCGRCGSHLGHVFGDGPPPTGLRYCMNAVALAFHEGGAPAAASELSQ